jgi:hypothetical protein
VEAARLRQLQEEEKKIRDENRSQRHRILNHPEILKRRKAAREMGLRETWDNFNNFDYIKSWLDRSRLSY